MNYLEIRNSEWIMIIQLALEDYNKRPFRFKHSTQKSLALI